MARIRFVWLGLFGKLPNRKFDSRKCEMAVNGVHSAYAQWFGYQAGITSRFAESPLKSRIKSH